MSKHNPEPWRYSRQVGPSVEGSIHSADGRLVAILIAPQIATHAELDADAQRIVACVNACAGIEDLSGLRRAVEDHRKVDRTVRQVVQSYEEFDRYLQTTIEFSNLTEVSKRLLQDARQAFQECFTKQQPSLPPATREDGTESPTSEWLMARGFHYNAGHIGLRLGRIRVLDSEPGMEPTLFLGDEEISDHPTKDMVRQLAAMTGWPLKEPV